MHDLIHDLALYVAKEEFVTVDSNTRKISEQARHLSITENDSLDRVLFPKSKSVRTILFPVEGMGLDDGSLLDIWVSRYKYLRFLDLDYSSFETLPNSIGELKHLHILFLSNNKKIKRLPDSIFKLHKLQYLAINGCTELETLPRGLSKLTSLRHLWITTKQSVLSLTEFANLNNLQLLVFEDCKNMKFVFSETQQLTSIETLSLDNCGSLESLPLHIFPKLQCLSIRDSKMLNLSLNNESRPVQKLMMKHLIIDNIPGLLTLPGWIEGAAETLETLTISELPNFHMLPECLTIMTHLKKLVIVGCPQLLSLPSGIHHITALEELHIIGCPKLCRKCYPQSGEYWPMIAHIKSVIIEEEEE
jgi:Leucine-rich repeat (LRR) protein